MPRPHWDCSRRSPNSRACRRRRASTACRSCPRCTAQPQPAHEFMYWEFHERGFQQAVRMGKWKAVRLAKDKPLELYNLADDPTE